MYLFTFFSKPQNAQPSVYSKPPANTSRTLPKPYSTPQQHDSKHQTDYSKHPTPYSNPPPPQQKKQETILNTKIPIYKPNKNPSLTIAASLRLILGVDERFESRGFPGLWIWGFGVLGLGV